MTSKCFSYVLAIKEGMCVERSTRARIAPVHLITTAPQCQIVGHYRGGNTSSIEFGMYALKDCLIQHHSYNIK